MNYDPALSRIEGMHTFIVELLPDDAASLDALDRLGATEAMLRCPKCRNVIPWSRYASRLRSWRAEHRCMIWANRVLLEVTLPDR